MFLRICIEMLDMSIEIRVLGIPILGLVAHRPKLMVPTYSLAHF